MTALKTTPEVPPEYRRLRQKLSNIGWLALGSLVERDKPGQGGPRYQWSRRVGAKTVTVALSAEQFSWLKHCAFPLSVIHLWHGSGFGLST